ncbi:MAG: hypothetical protein GY801_28070, partial [bacterium]|nr:hypothetical protein [bacterium]
MSKKVLTLSLVFALLIGSFAITVTAAEQVLIGAFANGPGGNGGQPAVPYSSAAGHTNIIKTYSPLTALDETGEVIVPYGAESWEFSDDFTIWTFKLRDGLKWNDGKDVTAEDVKFTVEFVTDPEYTPQRTADRNYCWGALVGFEDKIGGKIEQLDSAEVVDARTIRFTLTGPNPRFFANMYRSYILPKHAVDFAPKDYAATDWWVTPGKQVGSGPFFVSDH